MANSTQAVPENVEGDFFVDKTCIDCGTCRHVAPQSFTDTDDYSYVWAQPQGEQETRKALRALLACPTGSIGTRTPYPAIKEVRHDFPLQLTDGIFYNGYTSPKSYGASSYLLQHHEGNWLIDSPKFLPGVVESLKNLGGVRYIFLTHSDDVADAAEFAQYFGAQRIIHRQEAWSQPGAEIIIEGEEPVEFSPGFQIIPVPGHTQGSCCLLVDNRYLFSGDHCWWNPKSQALETPRFIYWNKTRLAESHATLMAQHTFEWVFPGHGMGVCLKQPEITF